MTTTDEVALAQMEDGVARRDDARIELTLLVSGASELSARAVANARAMCEEHMAGRYHLSVVDLYAPPASVQIGEVLGAPTLVKTRPLPLRKVAGDLSNTDEVLAALGLATPGTSSRSPH